MPSKKKKYNARFPAGRIKKIMQSDEEVGKVAQAVPIIISRTLELFVESMLTKTLKITNARNAKTLSPSHMKQCIMSESQFDFLRDIVKNVPDINVAEEQLAADDYSEDVAPPAAAPPPLQPQHAHHSNGSGAASGSGIHPHHRIVKQCSVDATAQNRPINFYGSAPAEAGPINYSTNNGKDRLSDKPPVPKLLRIESTPASFQSSSSAPTPPAARFVPVTSTKLSSTDRTPIINFDFSKFPIMPSSTSAPPSAAAPTNQPATKPETQSQAVKVIQRQTSTSKAQSTKSTAHTSSPATSSTVTSNTSIPMPSNAAPATVPFVSYHLPLSTVSNPSALEMDEDYDNI